MSVRFGMALRSVMMTAALCLLSLPMLSAQAPRVDKATALAEKDPAVLTALARLETFNADVSWLKLRLLDPNNADAHLNLGFIYLSQGNKTSAKKEFSAAVSIQPSLKSRIPAGDCLVPGGQQQ